VGNAFVHFQTLYDAAVEFEEHNKNVRLPPDTRVLDKNKIARWIEKVRPMFQNWQSWRIMKLQAGSNPAILLLPQSLLKKSSTQECRVV